MYFFVFENFQLMEPKKHYIWSEKNLHCYPWESNQDNRNSNHEQTAPL